MKKFLINELIINKTIQVETKVNVEGENEICIEDIVTISIKITIENL